MFMITYLKEFILCLLFTQHDFVAPELCPIRYDENLF